MSKHRSQENIIADILLIVGTKPKKTHIMFKANLSYELLNKYLDKLVEAKLIKYRRIGTFYELTARGSTYLTAYNDYENLRNQLEIYKSTLSKKETTLSEIMNF
jgi:predicted transcriptional regulator